MAAGRWLRAVGFVLMVSGVLAIAWALVVWRWQDPFTALYTLYEQRQLAGVYDRRARHFLDGQPAIPLHSQSAGPRAAGRTDVGVRQRAIRAQARAYRLES